MLDKEVAEILHEVDLHTYQMDIDIAPYAGNAFLDDDEGQMEFYKGFHRALVMMRKYLDEKRSPLLLKQYDAEQNQQTYSEYVKKQLATLKSYDHHLFADLVCGLKHEGWTEEGGSNVFALLHLDDRAIKVFRHAESPQVINICFSAEPEETDERKENPS